METLVPSVSPSVSLINTPLPLAAPTSSSRKRRRASSVRNEPMFRLEITVLLAAGLRSVATFISWLIIAPSLRLFLRRSMRTTPVPRGIIMLFKDTFTGIPPLYFFPTCYYYYSLICYSCNYHPTNLLVFLYLYFYLNKQY